MEIYANGRDLGGGGGWDKEQKMRANQIID